MQGSVTLEIKNNIGTIEFFHPQSNSLPSEILNKLASTISQAGTNDEVKVIIIKSPVYLHPFTSPNSFKK